MMYVVKFVPTWG